MIELLPQVPLPVPTPTNSTPVPAQADFGRWLATPLPSPPEDQPLLPGTAPFSPERSTPLPPPLLPSGGGDRAIAPLLPVAQPEPPSIPLAVPDPALVPPLEESVAMAWAMASAPGSTTTVHLVASPWRLAAGDQLSQQIEATLSLFMAEETPQALAVAKGQGQGPVPGAPSIPGLRTPPLRAGGDTTALGLVPIAAGVRLATAAAAEETAAVRGSVAGQAAHWPLRLLRWLNDGDGGRTVWLRDFTADAGAASGLVDDLRRFARAESLPLTRIVLNGQTLWTADTSLRDST